MRELIAALISILLVATTQLLFKQAIRTRGDKKGGVMARLFGLLLHPLVLLGICTNILGALCWLLAMSRLDLSFLFPLLSLNYLLVPLGAAICFKEQVGPRRKWGIALVCLGVVISSLGG